MRLAASVVVVAVSLGAPMASADTIRVPTDYDTIQEAMDAASSGDTVLVASGTYNEYDIVLKSGVVLMGDTGDPADVIVDALGLGRVFYGENLNTATRIECLTITGGYIGTTLGDNGGGMYCWSCSLTVADCCILDNAGCYGAGVYCGSESAPNFVGCRFQNNGINSAGRGGGLCCDSSRPIVTNCWFEGNSAESGGGMCCFLCQSCDIESCTFVGNESTKDGGGLTLLIECIGTVNQCIFRDNRAGDDAGGMFCGSACHADVSYSTFWGNEANGTSSTSGGVGGGFLCFEAVSNVTFSTFHANEAEALYGAGISSAGSGSECNVDNCIVAFSPRGMGLDCHASGVINLFCSDVYENADGDFVDCIDTLEGTDGNFSADPMFCDVSEGNFNLTEGSPCRLGNNPYDYPCGFVGAWHGDCSSTATEPESWSSLKSLYR